MDSEVPHAGTPMADPICDVAFDIYADTDASIRKSHESDG